MEGVVASLEGECYIGHVYSWQDQLVCVYVCEELGSYWKKSSTVFCLFLGFCEQLLLSLLLPRLAGWEVWRMREGEGEGEGEGEEEEEEEEGGKLKDNGQNRAQSYHILWK